MTDFNDKLSVLDGDGKRRVGLFGASAPRDTTARVAITGSNGNVLLRDADEKSTVRIAGDSATMWLGGGQNDGRIVMRDSGREDRIVATASDGNIQLANTEGNTIRLGGEEGTLWLGGADQDGRVVVRNGAGVERVAVGGSGDGITITGGQRWQDRGQANLSHKRLTFSKSDAPSVEISGSSAKVLVGSARPDAAILLDGENATVDVGGAGLHGELRLFTSSATRSTGSAPAVRISADEAAIHLGGWSISAPDYVFEPDYTLPSLEEIATHIRDEGHLPGVPSAAKISSDGVDLVAFSMTLLEKIEELTLHLLDVHERLRRVEATSQETRSP